MQENDKKLLAAPRQPMQLPESMSRDEMLAYYSDYANVCANEALRYQKRIRDLEAQVSAPRQPGEMGAGVLSAEKLAEMVMRLSSIANELRCYNPAADAYKGEHIHKVWAREIEAILDVPCANQPASAQQDEREAQWCGRCGKVRISCVACADMSDDKAVDIFAAELKAKLAKAREKGRGGWQQCEPGELSQMLREHVEKGDPRDVANFCMFLWHLDAPISRSAQQVQADAVAMPTGSEIYDALVEHCDGNGICIEPEVIDELADTVARFLQSRVADAEAIAAMSREQSGGGE